MLPKPQQSNESLQEVIKLYLSGLSTRKVADKANLPKTWVAKYLKSLGVTRSKEEANAFIVYRGTTWRARRSQARAIWKRHYGEIPPKHHIHHKDGNYNNNNLDNLELLRDTEHIKKHHPKNPIPRHLRPERQQYMKKYFSGRVESRTCPICSTVFTSSIYSPVGVCCSHRCGTAKSWRTTRAK